MQIIDRYLHHWSGKTVLITGGSSGIGFAIAEYINGVAKNIILVSSDICRLKEAESALLAKDFHSNVFALLCNIGDSHQVSLMANTVIRDVGCPHIIINNAGFAYYHTFDRMTAEEVEQTADVNFVGFLRVTRAFVNYLTELNVSTCIVNMASVAGSFPITPNAVYAGAKAGMVAFSELLEIELRPFGVNVLCVCPGRVVTSFFNHDSYSTRRTGFETSLVTPMEDVVHAVVKAVTLEKRTVFVPVYWRFFSWILNFDRILLRRFYKLLLARRIKRLRK